MVHCPSPFVEGDLSSATNARNSFMTPERNQHEWKTDHVLQRMRNSDPFSPSLPTPGNLPSSLDTVLLISVTVKSSDRDLATSGPPSSPLPSTVLAEDSYWNQCSSTPPVGLVRARPVLLVSSDAPVCRRHTWFGAHVCVAIAPIAHVERCRRSRIPSDVQTRPDRTVPVAQTDA